MATTWASVTRIGLARIGLASFGVNNLASRRDGQHVGKVRHELAQQMEGEAEDMPYVWFDDRPSPPDIALD